MATFSTHAEVLSENDLSMQAFRAGVNQKRPGITITEYVRRSGGRYEFFFPLSPELRAEIRNVAELTSDKALLAIAAKEGVMVSFEHLRHLDHETRIVIRAQLSYGPGESERLGLTTGSAIAPAKAFVVENK